MSVLCAWSSFVESAIEMRRCKIVLSAMCDKTDVFRRCHDSLAAPHLRSRCLHEACMQAAAGRTVNKSKTAWRPGSGSGGWLAIMLHRVLFCSGCLVPVSLFACDSIGAEEFCKELMQSVAGVACRSVHGRNQGSLAAKRGSAQ